jgi:hypothetical protein
MSIDSTLVAPAASAIGAAAVGLRAPLHLRGNHVVLNFGEDLLAFQAQAQGRQRDFYGSLPGADIHFDVFAGSDLSYQLQLPV